ncbi:PD-(D/E)XK nuclease family protein [Howardella ureilytica]
MNREIYTYTDLTKLKDSKLFSEIKHYPQFTVSSDLRKGLTGTMETDRVDGMFTGDKDVRITDFRNLVQAMNKDLGTDQSKFNEMVILSEYIRQRISEAGQNKKEINWLTGCMRNIGSLLADIDLMELAGIKPEDISTDGDRNLELMLDAWNYLAERDPTITTFRKTMSVKYTKSEWEPILKEAFKSKKSFSKADKLVFHGFYYITPLQERIMCLLEDAGFKLIFLFPYDERYPFVYEIWDETYSESRGYPTKDKWHMEKSNETDVYGDILEGKKNVTVPNKLRIKEYASVMEFVNDVKHIRREGYSIYSPDSISANKILKDYFPEAYGERNILSYPVGQFVGILNRMWNDERQTIVLDEKSLIECFSSGWLSVKGVSGRQYMQDLTYVLPFFEGCNTADEWEKRIELLKNIRQGAIEPFLTEPDADESVSRWQEAIGNPMANFSVFAVETEKLDVILSLIQQLLNMANKLFGKNQVIRVSDHIKKLDRILKSHEISDEMYTEERALVEDIFEKLGQESDFDAKCAPADISNALNIFICGRFDEGEIQRNRVGMVYPIFLVDAACIRNKGKVHVCMCDMNAMPGGNKEYVWPLTSSVMHKCYEKTHNHLIINLMHIMESTAHRNRYFMYSALKNKDVTISWISNVGDKMLTQSPYIKLVCEATGIAAEPAKRNTVTFARVAESPYGAGRTEEYDNERTPSGIIKEAQMAYALCPMKYTLGYILEKFPTYQSEFQQNYALNAFISAIYNLMKGKGVSVNQVYKNVMDLFPGLRKVEKRQVYDYISYDRRENDMDYSTRTECGGYFYTDERLKIHYPNQQLREAVIGRYCKLLTDDGRKGMNLYEVMEAGSEEKLYGRKDIVRRACMFCPHVDYCRNAIYYGERENLYD